MDKQGRSLRLACSSESLMQSLEQLKKEKGHNNVDRLHTTLNI